MIVKSFWMRVKMLIKERKMTQKQFAKDLGIPTGTFEGLIYHNRMPILTIAMQIANALDVSVEYLVSGKDRSLEQHAKEPFEKQFVSRISRLARQIQIEAEQIENKLNGFSA